MYEFVKTDSSFTIGVFSSYLWIWLLVAGGGGENARNGPVSWAFGLLADVGITVPNWIRNILLSPRPDLLLVMFVAALCLAYCAHLIPVVLVLAMEWHSPTSVWSAYVACVLVLALATAVVAKAGADTLGPGYAVVAKVLVPGFATAAFPILLVLGMFEKFTTAPADGPTLPRDWHSLKSTPVDRLTAADLARVLRIARDGTYVIPPQELPRNGFSAHRVIADSA
ncbi:hypothetical protein [Mycolicibacterium neworleansense]|uniref:hypothetical protein n=1 Tax=Mycolicibacterium neworleansense TaxID=146018 RepID=UPI00103E3A63|nr:hypothetical protein [Mycolicibacterium neworleansense]MCV7364824.1 hypothetical protein [Mycolicibacterium neworleansense]